MRFSVTFGAVGPGRDPRGLAQLARMAEDCGWDAVFLEDYLVYQGDTSMPTYDPWICLAAMAAATSTIRLGTTVTPVPRRRPWKLAAEAVALDHLSGGRFILGVGIGDPGDPFLGGVGEASEPRVLAEKLDESLEIIDALWTGEPVHHKGKHYKVDGVQLTARPVQSPRIPIWVGGNLLVPAVRRRILRWDGSCAYKGSTDAPQPITPEDVRSLLAEVSAERGSAAGFDLKVSSGDPAAFAKAGATWWGRWFPPGDITTSHNLLRTGPPRFSWLLHHPSTAVPCRTLSLAGFPLVGVGFPRFGQGVTHPTRGQPVARSGDTPGSVALAGGAGAGYRGSPSDSRPWSVLSPCCGGSLIVRPVGQPRPKERPPLRHENRSDLRSGPALHHLTPAGISGRCSRTHRQAGRAEQSGRGLPGITSARAHDPQEEQPTQTTREPFARR